MINTEGTTWCAAGSSCPSAASHGGVKIEVYSVKRTGDPATDGALGQLIGSTIEASDTMTLVETPVKDSCVDEIRFDREYEYADVPMNTELVIKTYGPGWSPLYTYNVYVHEGDPDYDATAGTYTYKIRALAEDDFGTIPTAAIGKTVTDGNGVIGGEVHDCGNVRLQFARVDVSQNRVALEYFNDSEDDPLPEGSRREIGTGKTALYSAFDVKGVGQRGKLHPSRRHRARARRRQGQAGEPRLLRRPRVPQQRHQRHAARAPAVPAQVTAARETTTDALFDGALVVEQPTSGYRFNVDALWLGAFAAGHRRAATPARPGRRRRRGDAHRAPLRGRRARDAGRKGSDAGAGSARRTSRALRSTRK